MLDLMLAGALKVLGPMEKSFGEPHDPAASSRDKLK